MPSGRPVPPGTCGTPRSPAAACAADSRVVRTLCSPSIGTPATLADRARRDERTRDEYPHSLYKGAFSLAVLFADLEHPEDACFPFYELRPDTLRELP